MTHPAHILDQIPSKQGLGRFPPCPLPYFRLRSNEQCVVGQGLTYQDFQVLKITFCVTQSQLLYPSDPVYSFIKHRCQQ